MPTPEIAWHISTFSADGGGNCVEAGPLQDGSGRIAVRRSRLRDTVIVYTRAEWQAFLDGGRAGEFDFSHQLAPDANKAGSIRTTAANDPWLRGRKVTYFTRFAWTRYALYSSIRPPSGSTGFHAIRCHCCYIHRWMPWSAPRIAIELLDLV
ncbi:DUF397 domain-containing protein [Nonomuraea salmonea]|uniref:DUF397 domain-containing protein n=1 Tax=Nonomuraea salmonea TaxID=46181 RepID=A0ABV5NMN3_9ACTN